MKNKTSTSRSFVVLSTITIVEKILSFIYQAMIAGMIGANSISDAYFTSTEFFVLIDSTLLSALVIVLLKIYTQKTADKGIIKADAFLNNVVRIVLPLTIVLSLIIFFSSYPLTFIIGPGYDSETRFILNKNIKFMSIVPIFLSITSVSLAVLRREKNFLIVGLKSLFISTSGMMFVIIAHVTSFPKTNVLCLGYVLAYFLYMLTTCITTRQHHILKIGLPTFGNDEKILLKMLLPLVISNGILKVSMMIDKIICSTIGEGAVSCLTYSHTLYFFVEALFITNLSTVLLSDFNELSAKGQRVQMSNKISKAISLMEIILIPITIITVIFRYDIVRIVFMRGTFKESDVIRVGNLIMVYAIGFVPSVISNIYMQVHYAEGKTAITMRYSLISIGINIVSSIILSHIIGLPGIAIGTVISIVISVFLYNGTINKLVPEYNGAFNLNKLLKLFIASCICVIIVLVIHTFISNPIISFVCASTLSLISFIITLCVLKYSEANELIVSIYQKCKSRIKNER